ncbi:MAG: hypothetical protein U0V72_12545 [Cytophagales bacterium]
MIRKIFRLIFGIIVIFWIPFWTSFFPVGEDPYSFLIVELFSIVVVLLVFLINKNTIKYHLHYAVFVVLILFNSFFFISINKSHLSTYTELLVKGTSLILEKNARIEDLNEMGLDGICASKKINDKIAEGTFSCIVNYYGDYKQIDIVDYKVLKNETENDCKISISSIGKEVHIYLDCDSIKDTLILKHKKIINHDSILENYYTHELLTINYTNNLLFSIYFTNYDYIRNYCFLYKLIYFLY